jgi:AraC-like DNA-binding protein
VDALDAVLAVAGVRGTIAATLNAADPWGFDLDEIPGAAFHAVTEGAAWLCPPGQPGIRLLPGDVVLLPTGTAHVLASSPDAGTVPFDRAAAQRALAAGEELHVGCGKPQTRILCASYRQDPAITLPLLTLLPDLLHIPAARASTALGTTLQLLAQEIGQPAPGSAAVLNRIVDILFVQVLRTWLTATPPAPQGPTWLAALADPVAGPALAAQYTQPGHDWTVASLAAATGVSRATLTRRFSATAGDTPAAHLTRWRMDLAAQRLRDSDDTLAAIARSVGYTSEYAFSHAFTRARGIPPGRYRTRSRATDGPEAAKPGQDGLALRGTRQRHTGSRQPSTGPEH